MPSATRWACLLVAVLSAAGTVRAADPNRLDIKVVIESVKHTGNDEYSVAVTTTNKSSKHAEVLIVKEGFFVQTDQGWTALKARSRQPDTEFQLDPQKTKEREMELSIPLSLPSLFSTYEGDLSLMYKFTYQVRGPDGNGALRSDEVYCWVRPGTSQWILREGM